MNSPEQEAVKVILPTLHQQLFSIGVAIVLIAFIVVLVRRRTIREEYSILWLLTGVGILALALSTDLMRFLVLISGVKMASSILFLAGIVFLVFINIHMSAIISRHRTMIKNLSIRVAILDAQLSAKQGSSVSQEESGRDRDEHPRH